MTTKKLDRKEVFRSRPLLSDSLFKLTRVKKFMGIPDSEIAYTQDYFNDKKVRDFLKKNLRTSADGKHLTTIKKILDIANKLFDRHVQSRANGNVSYVVRAYMDFNDTRTIMMLFNAMITLSIKIPCREKQEGRIQYFRAFGLNGNQKVMVDFNKDEISTLILILMEYYLARCGKLTRTSKNKFPLVYSLYEDDTRYKTHREAADMRLNTFISENLGNRHHIYDDRLNAAIAEAVNLSFIPVALPGAYKRAYGDMSDVSDYTNGAHILNICISDEKKPEIDAVLVRPFDEYYIIPSISYFYVEVDRTMKVHAELILMNPHEVCILKVKMAWNGEVGPQSIYTIVSFDKDVASKFVFLPFPRFENISFIASGFSFFYIDGLDNKAAYQSISAFIQKSYKNKKTAESIALAHAIPRYTSQDFQETVTLIRKHLIRNISLNSMTLNDIYRGDGVPHKKKLTKKEEQSLRTGMDGVIIDHPKQSMEYSFEQNTFMKLYINRYLRDIFNESPIIGQFLLRNGSFGETNIFGNVGFWNKHLTDTLLKNVYSDNINIFEAIKKTAGFNALFIKNILGLKNRQLTKEARRSLSNSEISMSQNTRPNQEILYLHDCWVNWSQKNKGTPYLPVKVALWVISVSQCNFFRMLMSGPSHNQDDKLKIEHRLYNIQPNEKWLSHGVSEIDDTCRSLIKIHPIFNKLQYYDFLTLLGFVRKGNEFNDIMRLTILSHERNAEWTRLISRLLTHNINSECDIEKDRTQWPALLEDISYENGTLKCLLNSGELEEESQEMTHCVRGYSDTCFSLESHIFRIRGVDGTKATLQISRGNNGFTIVQNKAEHNQPVSGDALAITKKFMGSKELKDIHSRYNEVFGQLKQENTEFLRRLQGQQTLENLMDGISRYWDDYKRFLPKKTSFEAIALSVNKVIEMQA